MKSRAAMTFFPNSQYSQSNSGVSISVTKSNGSTVKQGHRNYRCPVEQNQLVE